MASVSKMTPARVLLLLFLLGPAISAAKIKTSFHFTSMSPYNPLLVQDIDIKGSIFGTGGTTVDDLARYEDMLCKLEVAALELCANSVMEFSWSGASYAGGAQFFYGSGVAVCDESLFGPDQTDCSCV